MADCTTARAMAMSAFIIRASLALLIFVTTVITMGVMIMGLHFPVLVRRRVMLVMKPRHMVGIHVATRQNTVGRKTKEQAEQEEKDTVSKFHNK